MTDATQSLQERLAKRREQLQQENVFELAIPGYEDILVAKYHTLDYRVLRTIGQRAEAIKDTGEQEIAVAADTLIEACDGLFSKNDDGTVSPLNRRYSTAAARELFGVSTDELPDNSTARQALLAMVPDTTALMLHFVQYDAEARKVHTVVTEAIQGNSEASSVTA